MKTILKFILKKCFIIIVLPLYLLLVLLTLGRNSNATFQGFSQFLSLIPGKLGIYARAAFYHLACPATSDNISIGFMTIFSHRDTSIAEGVYIGPQGNIGKCSIGKNTLLGSGVHILSGKNQHDFSDLSKPIQQQGGVFTKIHIGEDCWLGNGAIVMANVANQCIVAAGSVLTKDTVSEPT
ncbi:MAG: acyltransferase, partial [Paraglaciecola sp.]|nr:acyltransferase [Paraglaciecola sp.]